MSFRLLQNLVTLDDLERRNSTNRLNFTEFGSFRGGLRKVVKYTRMLAAAEIYGQRM